MIVKMDKLELCGLERDRAEIIAGLMKRRCVQIDAPEIHREYEQVRELTVRGSAETFETEQKLARLGSAIKLLSPYAAKGGLFPKKREVEFECLTKTENIESALKLCDEAERLSDEIERLREKKSGAALSIEKLSPWRQLDIPLDMTSTRECAVSYFSLDASHDGEKLISGLGEAVPEAAASQIGGDSQFKYYAVLSHRSASDALGAFARENGLTRIPLSGSGLPADEIARCESMIESCDAELAERETQLKALAESIDVLHVGYDCCGAELECARAGGRLLKTHDAFILTGWAPQNKRARIESFLKGYDCTWEFTDPGEDENMPVLLHNSRLTRPFESITEMYGLPSPLGVDPNNVMAPFFFLFFGMMLSDAGYGLLLLIAGIVALKCMQLGEGGKKFMGLVAWCGASTVIWGALYGSWFGDSISVIASTYFGRTLTIPALIDPLTQPTTILIISMLFGAVHLFVGMGVKAYMLIKRGHFWSAVFDVGFWYLVLIGLPLMLLGGAFMKIGMWMAIAGAAGLLLTQGREKKGVFGKITGGLLSLYDITGYLSDVLSYSRILALGMATCVIGMVVNQIGSLFGSSILSALIFVVIFIGGHLLNLAINALGAYVHASRLQYVEFFGKFYEGGGKPFTPLKAETKYTFLTNREDY